MRRREGGHETSRKDIHVRLERVRPEECTRPLVALDAVLLRSRHIVSVRRRRPAHLHDRLNPLRHQPSSHNRLLDGFLQPPSRHRREFAGYNKDVQLAETQDLHLNDRWPPVVRLVNLTNVEQDRFGRLTLDLFRARILDERLTTSQKGLW